MKKVVLIDGDEFIFRATAALEREIKWDDNNHVLYADEEQSWSNFQGMIRRVLTRFETGEHILCFSEPPNFRHSIDPTYKNNRANSRKPMCYAALKERTKTRYKVVSMAGLEADDVMGILATQPSKHQKIIVSQDKDMKTIPTTIWDGKDLHVITEAQADYKHMYQTLIGDTSDGYKGCPKIGPVKADKLLMAPCKCGYPETACDKTKHDYGHDCVVANWWLTVVKTYEKAGLTEADALVQARLARILRWSDWDREKKEPILWLPPNQTAT